MRVACEPTCGGCNAFVEFSVMKNDGSDGVEGHTFMTLVYIISHKQYCVDCQKSILELYPSKTAHGGKPRGNLRD